MSAESWHWQGAGKNNIFEINIVFSGGLALYASLGREVASWWNRMSAESWHWQGAGKNNIFEINIVFSGGLALYASLGREVASPPQLE
jgi:hypothetical protein